jgi:hypothetical protein
MNLPCSTQMPVVEVVKVLALLVTPVPRLAIPITPTAIRDPIY